MSCKCKWCEQLNHCFLNLAVANTHFAHLACSLQFSWVNVVTLSVCNLQLSKFHFHLKSLCEPSFSCFTGYTQNHMWLCWCAFASASRAFICSDNKKHSWWRAPLHKDSTLEKSLVLKSSRNADPFIFSESHVSNWEPPLWLETFVHWRRLKNARAGRI